MKENETWKDIPGYEGRYQASDLGNIRSLDRWITCSDGRKIFYEGKQLIANVSGNKRRTVKISKEGENKTFSVYVLVALTFLGPRPEGFEVCHKNGICTDDRLENLRYGTQMSNVIDRYRHGEFGRSLNIKPKPKYTRVGHGQKKVECVTTGVIYDSIKEASRQTGILASNISHCCHSRRKIAGGYQWAFAENLPSA